MKFRLCGIAMCFALASCGEAATEPALQTDQVDLSAFPESVEQMS